MDEATLGRAQPQLRRLEREGDVARGRSLDDLAGAVADHLLVADDVEDDVAARMQPLVERYLCGPQRRREATLHVGRASAVERPSTTAPPNGSATTRRCRRPAQRRRER